MKELKFKKVIFYPTEIVIMNKKGNITIPVGDISTIEYDPLKIWDCLPIFNIGRTPRLFSIYLNKEINGTKQHAFLMRRKNVLKLQEFFQKEIIIL